MAERVGFEPTVVLPLRLISSQVHSTTLPPLRDSKPASIARFSGCQHRDAAQVGAQHFGHRHAAVGLLVVFQHRHQRAAYGQAGAPELQGDG